MRLLLTIAMLVLPTTVFAAECSTRSGPKTAALVELYTSEGCSSCPPADRWLSSLQATPSLVPLAFHVDYWDYIGWKDPFASPQFTLRQREARSASGSRYVYTPQVILSGRDWREWSSPTALARSLAASQAKPARADIALEASVKAGMLQVRANAQVGDAVKAGGTELVLALTESKLVTRVRAGENRGETLSHDHVVRELRKWPIAAGTVEAAQGFALAPDWKRADLAIVAFVQDRATGDVLQALRLATCP